MEQAAATQATAMGHCIENTGSTTLRFLEPFRSSYYADLPRKTVLVVEKVCGSRGARSFRRSGRARHRT